MLDWYEELVKNGSADNIPLSAKREILKKIQVTDPWYSPKALTCWVNSQRERARTYLYHFFQVATYLLLTTKLYRRDCAEKSIETHSSIFKEFYIKIEDEDVVPPLQAEHPSVITDATGRIAPEPQMKIDTGMC